MNEVWLVVGYSYRNRDRIEWTVTVYPEEHPAQIHCLVLLQRLEECLSGGTPPDYSKIDPLDPSAWRYGPPEGWRVEKHPFVRHPDEFIERNGGGI